MFSLVNKPEGSSEPGGAGASRPGGPPVPAPAVHRRILLCDDSPAIHDDIRKVLCPASVADTAVAKLEADLFGGASLPPADEYEIDSAYQGVDAVALLQRCVQELTAELRGENGALANFAAPKRRGRRPKHLQFHELHVA